VIVAVCLCVSEEGDDSSKTNDQTWGDTDRDYTYDEVSFYLFCFIKLKMIGYEHYSGNIFYSLFRLNVFFI